MKKLLLSLALLSTGLVQAAPTAKLQINARILGLELSPEGLTLQVPSGGCMSPANFKVSIQETLPMTIKIDAARPDFCEAYLPFGQGVTFSFAELGLSSGHEITIDTKSGAMVGRQTLLDLNGVLGFSLNREGVEIQVASGGCTSRDDFEVRQTMSDRTGVQGSFLISVIRTGVDMCEAYLPYGTKVAFTYEELGIESSEALKLKVSTGTIEFRIP